MLAGDLYNAMDAELQAEQQAAAHWMAEFNASMAATPADKFAMLKRGLGAIGEGTMIRPPFFIDYGSNIKIGRGCFMNFNCCVLDVCEVTIGDGTLIGPNVQIYAADHPRDPAVRKTGLENGKPVRIGKNVWIGGGAMIMPGVTVGDDAVIGAGSVVTRDVPAGATVAGNPARVLKKKDAPAAAVNGQ